MVFRPERCSIERRSGVMRWRVLVVDWVDAAIPRRRPTGSSSRGVQKCDGGGEHGPEDFGDHGGPEVPEGLDGPEDSEPVAAQVFWEEPSDDGCLAGLGEAEAQTAEHETDQQDGPPVLLPREHAPAIRAPTTLPAAPPCGFPSLEARKTPCSPCSNDLPAPVSSPSVSIHGSTANALRNRPRT